MWARFRDGDRVQWWPARIFIGDAASSTWFARHGWQIGSEPTPDGSTGYGCIQGVRRVFGQTFHLGRLKLSLGRYRQGESETTIQEPPETA